MVIPSKLAYSVDTLDETVAVPIAVLRSRNRRTEYERSLPDWVLPLIEYGAPKEGLSG